MIDNDSAIIKPVEQSQNVGGLTPAQRREERKRRKNMHRENTEKPEQEQNDPDENKSAGNEFTEKEKARHSIDYCA